MVGVMRRVGTRGIVTQFHDRGGSIGATGAVSNMQDIHGDGPGYARGGLWWSSLGDS